MRLLERFKAEAAERRLLRVPDAGFDLPFAIGIADAAPERDHAVVRQHIAIQRIERGIVNVGREHALFQIVEDDDAHGPAKPTKRALMELRPDLRARSPHEQSDRLPRAPERQDKEPCAPVLARGAIADHRTFAVVDLAFFARRGRDDDARIRRRAAAQCDDETADTRVARGKAMVVDEVLPDRDGVASTRERLGDDLAIRFARARSGGSARGTHRVGRHFLAGNGRLCSKVGGHLCPGNGRFCFRFALPAAAGHRDPGGFQVTADGLRRTPSACSIRRSDHPSRPSARICCCLSLSKTLLMPVTELAFRPDVNVSIATGMAGFQLSINGRFWVSTEAGG